MHHPPYDDDKNMARIENGCFWLIGLIALSIIGAILYNVWKEFDLLINLMGEPK